jgi:hypothetical protein
VQNLHLHPSAGNPAAQRMLVAVSAHSIENVKSPAHARAAGGRAPRSPRNMLRRLSAIPGSLRSQRPNGSDRYDYVMVYYAATANA